MIENRVTDLLRRVSEAGVAGPLGLLSLDSERLHHRIWTAQWFGDALAQFTLFHSDGLPV